MNVSKFIKELKSYHGENVFNPYAHKCTLYDRHDADRVRRRNLARLLDAALLTGVDSVWIGRDLGYKGGRRTGLALTDEYHLDKAARRWNIELCKATKGEIVKERTAVNIWNILDTIDERVFMWNVFPFHPHEYDNVLSNRSHTALERDQGLAYLVNLIELLQPKKIVAIGNDAFNCSNKVFTDKTIYKVRHPSYGGEKDFKIQMKKIHNSI